MSKTWGGQERADIIKSLNLLEPLGMMQETLVGIQAGKLFDFLPDKITLSPGYDAAYDAFSRTIILPTDLKVKGKYLDEDNQTHQLSLGRVLLHEPQHAIDPDFTDTCRRAAKKVTEITGCTLEEACEMLSDQMQGKMGRMNQLPEELQLDLSIALGEVMGNLQWNEHIAESRENPVMEIFFGEKPRAQYSDSQLWQREEYRLEVPSPTV